MSHIPTKPINLTADQTLETLVTIGEAVALNGEWGSIGFTLKSAGGTAVALDQFEMQFQFEPNGTWQTVTSAWDSDADFLIYASGTLNTMAHASDEHALVNVVGIHGVRFQSAQAGATASAVTVTIDGMISSIPAPKH